MSEEQTSRYVATACQYADDILANRIPGSKLVKAACLRFHNDVKEASKKRSRWPYEFHVRSAHRRCVFLESLPHVKGQWATRRERLLLSPWQIFCTVNIYGWRHKKTKKRRFREAYIELPRKNGKSLFAAGVGLSHLCLDGELGAEVYCGATTEKQAWEVFRPAKQIIERFEILREHYGIVPHAKSISRPGTGDRFEAVIGQPGDGASPSCAIVDEYHEHKTSDQVDTFITGQGARAEPLTLYITTAGTDHGSPCYMKRADCIDILNGTVQDDRVFCIIYGLDDDDEWDTVEAQKKANPNYGISVSEDFLEGQLTQARRSSVRQTAYRTKHLNQWLGAKLAWMNMLSYQRCRKKSLDLSDFHGQSCYIGVDLASNQDVACLALLFESGGTYSVFMRHYLPEKVIEEGGSTRYKAWHAEGWITATPGNTIDIDFIEEDLIGFRSLFEIVEVPYDPFQATQFATHLLEEGFPMIEYGATVKNFSEPMKFLEKLVIDGNIAFQWDPVLAWMFGNVVARLDAKDNIFPRKERPEAKIDGVVALIMALARSIAERDDGVTLPPDYTAEVV